MKPMICRWVRTRDRLPPEEKIVMSKRNGMLHLVQRRDAAKVFLNPTVPIVWQYNRTYYAPRPTEWLEILE